MYKIMPGFYFLALVGAINKPNNIFEKIKFNIFNDSVFYFPFHESDKNSLKVKI